MNSIPNSPRSHKASEEFCLDWLSPHRAALLGILTYALFLAVAPLVVTIPISPLAVAYLTACLAMFFAGLALDSLLPKKPPAPSISTAAHLNYGLLYNIVTGLGLLGMLSRFYDRFFARGMDLTQTVLERREALEAVGTNLWSTIAAALFPFCFVSLFVYFLSQRYGSAKPGRFRFACSGVLFFLPVVDSISIGSRSLIITAFALLFMILLFFGRLQVNLKTLAWLLVASSSLMALSTWIFLQRLSAMGLLALASVVHSGYAFTMQPNAWAQDVLNRAESTIWFLPIFVAVNLCQYVLHGVYEFFYFFAHFPGPHTAGQDLFGVYFKVADTFFGGKNTAAYVLSLQPRPGVYTTFFGPVYADFGWFGPIFMLVFGFILARLRAFARRGDHGVVPLYFYLILVVALFPVVNMISNAEGLFVITTFAVFLLLQRLCVRATLPSVVAASHPAPER